MAIEVPQSLSRLAKWSAAVAVVPGTQWPLYNAFLHGPRKADVTGFRALRI